MWMDAAQSTFKIWAPALPKQSGQRTNNGDAYFVPTDSVLLAVLSHSYTHMQFVLCSAVRPAGLYTTYSVDAIHTLLVKL